jgi:hypothetical protein
MVTYHDGSKPTRRPILTPPTPDVKAVAVGSHEVEFTWSFEKLPRGCRPAIVALTIHNDLPYTPMTELVPVTGRQGTHRMTLPDFIPRPDKALVSALGSRGQRSGMVRVSIER